MNKLKVLQLIDSLNVGGAEVLAVNIANSLANYENIESFLCVTRKEGELKKSIQSNVRYLFLKKKKIIDFSSVFLLRKFIKENKIQILHAHSTSFFIALCVKLIYSNVKIVWHDHYGNSDFLYKRNVFSLKLSSYFFSQIISVNHKLERWAKENLRCNKVLFVNNFPIFNTTNNETKLLGIANKRIVHVAGYREQKDHINLLKAFKIVLKEHTEWTLHLIGKDYENEYSSLIHEFIIKEEINESVFQYGVCSDIENILAQSTLGVLSSNSEGLPIALLEYGLAKIPAIVTDVGECAKVVGCLGAVVPPKNHLLLSEVIINLINDKNSQIEFAKIFNENVQEYYSKEKVINELIKIYKEC
ncbi:MAG: glycosyltransferase involved in cell wall biosynthesis [Polaribacter sp.]|jgi:glycosyltransferase involved in cell wall biosynthesis